MKLPAALATHHQPASGPGEATSPPGLAIKLRLFLFGGWHRVAVGFPTLGGGGIASTMAAGAPPPAPVRQAGGR